MGFCQSIKNRIPFWTVSDDGAMLSYGRGYVNEINAVFFKKAEIVEIGIHKVGLCGGGSCINDIGACDVWRGGASL